MKEWLDGYEHVAVDSCAGSYIKDVPWRMVLHTTESPPCKVDAVVAWFKARPCSAPHFVIDPCAGRKIQLISLSQSSCALKNLRGGIETNRARAIQTEIVGRAGESPDWDDRYLQFIGSHIADVVAAGVPINLDRSVGFVGPEAGFIARVDAPQRLSVQDWLAADYVLGHQHVPENTHWDPGMLNIDKILYFAKNALVSAGRTPVEQPQRPERSRYRRVLRRGAVGEDVLDWQKRLADRGFRVAADGVFGAVTESETRRFQKMRGIDADGIVGIQTVAAMAAAERAGWMAAERKEPLVPPWPGRYLRMTNPLMSGDDVRMWQNRMRQRGWRIAVDGVYGPQSRNVCEQFQAEKRLPVDGVVGPRTWAAAWTLPT